MTRVAIQGVRGAFSHAAARAALGDDVDVVECRTFEDLFGAVVGRDADRGVVPVENSLAGAVQPSLDLLVRHPLHAVAEVRVRIRLCLASRPGRRLRQLERVASHPVALLQCRRFFDRHPELASVAAFDTAGSIRDLMADDDPGYDAAIGSELAASLYAADILERDLEDDPGNYTRFLIVGREPVPAPERCAKTSIAFQVRHVPGSLHAALGVLRRYGVDLTRLESRPIPGRPWEYRFYADLRGPPPTVQALAVNELRSVADEVRILGTYKEEPHALREELPAG